MKWFDLIFSDQYVKRLRRHLIFWTAWWFYFAATYFFTQQGFAHAGSANWIIIILIKSFLLVAAHMFIVNTSLYILLPRIKLSMRFPFISLFMLCIGMIAFTWSYFCFTTLFSPLDRWFHLTSTITKENLLWSSFNAGVISALKVLAAATAIKLLKGWYFKQEHNARLEREKVSVELELLKAQIHPDVLFNSLDQIYVFAQTDTARASQLLLKLSDLLSYILYECNQPLVPLEKEIKMLKDYMALEKTKSGDQLDLSISVKGNVLDKMIAPLLLLPFVENSMMYCGHQNLEKAWINIEIRIDENKLSMKLVNGKLDQQAIILPNENGLANATKRLQLLYMNKNEIKIHTEPEIMMTIVKIDLETGSPENALVTC